MQHSDWMILEYEDETHTQLFYECEIHTQKFY